MGKMARFMGIDRFRYTTNVCTYVNKGQYLAHNKGSPLHHYIFYTKNDKIENQGFILPSPILHSKLDP
jgi:hypothetical protein